MTKHANKPFFALSQRHLKAFSLQMTDVADQFAASRSMDVLPVPPASSRWSEVAAMTAEDVVHGLMEQICERGATAVDHLWPILPSLTLIEERLRQLIPSNTHVLRRMLRDGPWPGEGAKVKAPFKLPPLPSCWIQSSPAVPSADHVLASPTVVTVPTHRLQKAPHLAFSRHASISPAASFSRHEDTSLAQAVSRHDDVSPATPLSRHDDISPATPLSCHDHAVLRPPSPSHATVRVTHSPTISSTAPARTSPSQQTDMQPIQAANTSQHVSLDACSDQSASSHSAPASASAHSSLSQSVPHSTGSSSSVDSQTLSEIEAKIAVLTKWGLPLPPSLDLPQSPSRHAKGPTPRLRLKKQDVRQAEQLSISIRHADSAPFQQPAMETPSDVNSQMRRESASVAQTAAQAVLKRQAAVETETPSQTISKRTKSAHSTPQTLPQQSLKSKLHPPRAATASQGLTQQQQPAPKSSRSPSSAQNSPSLAQSSPSLAQSSPSLAESSPSLPQGSLPQSSPSLAQSSPSFAQSSPSLLKSSPQLPHQASRQGSQEPQGLREGALTPKAQSPLQMWPHVRKYTVSQPLTAPSTVTPNTATPPPLKSPIGVSQTQLLRPSNKENQLHRQSPAQRSHRHSGTANPSSMASPDCCPSPVLRSATAPATVLTHMLKNLPADSQHPVDSCIQPQTPLPSPSHRRMYSQDACQLQHTDVAVRPDKHTTAENVDTKHTPEWIAHESSSTQRGMAGAAVAGDIWQTPQLPSTWSGQGMAPEPVMISLVD